MGIYFLSVLFKYVFPHAHLALLTISLLTRKIFQKNIYQIQYDTHYIYYLWCKISRLARNVRGPLEIFLDKLNH